MLVGIAVRSSDAANPASFTAMRKCKARHERHEGCRPAFLFQFSLGALRVRKPESGGEMGMQAVQSAAAPVGELVGDYRWFPEDFHASRQMLSFVFTERETLAREPFLDHRWQQDRLER